MCVCVCFSERKEWLIKVRREEGPQVKVMLILVSDVHDMPTGMPPIFRDRDVACTEQLVLKFKFVLIHSILLVDDVRL